MASDSPIAHDIRQRIGDRSLSFVFPTQADADSWARGVLECGIAKAVETERFMSWDRYIDICRTPRNTTERKKADIRIRLLWALSVMELHRKEPFLRHILQPGVRPPRSRAGYLARLAPSLEEMCRNLSGDEGISHDCIALAGNYAKYLSDTGFFEGQSQAFKVPEGRSFLVVSPELCPGFQSLAGELEKNDNIHLSAHLEEIADTKTGGTLFRFATQWDELDAVFASCRKLLDQGMRPEDIAFSCPVVSPEIREYLDFFSRCYDIPLAFRSGTPLSSSPFGRLLRSMAFLSKEGFSTRTLRSFNDIAPFRWLDAASFSALLRFASRYSIPELSADAYPTLETWRKTFALCGRKNASTQDYFSRLLRSIDSITRASNFKALRIALYDFRSNFLDEGFLSERGQKTLQRCLVELDLLERLEESGQRIPAEISPFEILLQILDLVSYVAPDPTPAISVYPYHIGAHVSQSIHFVLDASQESTKPLANLLAQIPPDLEYVRQGKAPDESLIFASFNTVCAIYCHADESLSGVTVPHPYFSSRGFTVIRQDSKESSPDLAEMNAWSSANPGLLPQTISRQSRQSALAEFIKPKLKQAEGLDSRNLFRLGSCNAEPYIKISPSRLGEISLCPFRWFFSCIPEACYDSNSIVFRAEGLMYHALVQAILRELSDQTGHLHREYSERFGKAFDTVLPHCMALALSESGPSLGTALTAAIPKIRSRLERFLDYEYTFEQGGWNIGSFEVNLAEPFEEARILLSGRADRVCTRPSATEETPEKEEYAIVDYKRNRIPGKKAVLVDGQGMLMDLQLAAYSRMLFSMDRSVEQAHYFSIESCTSRVVFGPKGARPSWNDFEPERRALENAIDSAGRILKEGSFLAIKPSDRSCALCTARPSCRAHYHSEPL